MEIPETSSFSQRLKQFASAVINSRPPKLDENTMRQMRYTITNLVDDIRQPRSKEELVASGTALYGMLANCYLRTNDFWSAKDKSIPRKLKLANPEFGLRFCEDFARLFATGQTAKVIALSEKILEPLGGFLFDGYKLDALSHNHKPFDKSND